MLEHFPKKENRDALLNEFDSTALLAANGPTTAQWMADRVGKTDGRHQHDPQSTTGGRVDWIHSIDPAQFQTLGQGETISPDRVPGVFTNRQLGAWFFRGALDLPAPLANVPSLEPIPEAWQTLRPWDDEDLARLNLLDVRDELDLDQDTDGTSGAPVPRAPKSDPPTLTTHSYPRFQP